MSIENFIFSAVKKIYKKKKIFLHEPFIDNDDLRSLNKCLKSKFVSTVGKGVDLFEKKVSLYTKSKYVVALNSGTSSLHLSLLALGVKKNDEVLLSGTSFVASPNSIIYCEASPHFIDIEEETFGINAIKLEKYLRENTIMKKNQCFNKNTGNRIKCIMIVHIFGLCNDYLNIIKIAKKFKIKIIEDAAEGLGTFYKNRHVGTLGDLGIISFNGNKTITTGAGGCIMTNNSKLYRKINNLASTAKKKHKFEFLYNGLGFNYKMTNMQAYLGLSQLSKLKKILNAKRKIHLKYKKFFKNNKYFILNSEKNYCKSNYWLNSITLKKKYIKKRNQIILKLMKKNIFCRPLWPEFSSVNHLKKYPKMNLSNTRILSKSTICLPSSPLI